MVCFFIGHEVAVQEMRQWKVEEKGSEVMLDSFGYWISACWIRAVQEKCISYPMANWTYINKRLLELNLHRIETY